MTHAFVNIALPFPQQNADAVDALLESMIPDLRKDGKIRDALRLRSIHFMTITVVRGDHPEPTHLFMEVSADGTTQATLDLLQSALADWIEKIFDIAGIAVKGDLKALLTRHVIKTGQGLFDTPGLHFTGLPGMMVSRVRDEYDLARELRTYFDVHPVVGPPLATLRQARAHIAANPELAKLLDALPVPRLALAGETTLLFYVCLAARGVLKFFWPLLLIIAALTAFAVAKIWCAEGGVMGLLTLAALLALSVVLVLAALAFFYARLRATEQANTPDDSLPNPRVLDEVMKHENWSMQNHLAGISRMQPGWVRFLSLRIAFWVIGQMAKRIYKPGHLAEIGTIHFARWVLLPKTNKLLFLSNYGGSWESYLEDFITKAANGLTGVWSNTTGFPRAKNLFQDGATDGERFKRWARRQQQPTRFWYSAYPNLTTARIRLNAVIRQGLATASTTDEASAWLALFGSKSPPASVIETREVQTLLFGGLSKHPHAACLAVTLPEDKAAARAWLRAFEPSISYGDDLPQANVRILCLARSGLEKLDLPEDTMNAFPTAYRQGMSHQTRANILSDTGDDKPAKWAWGRQDGPALDAAILLYAQRKTDLTRQQKDVEQLLKKNGGAIAHIIMLAELTDEKDAGGKRIASREPFGFADGVSQPIIRGTKRFLRQSDSIHVVEPGEFLLGYPNNRGFVPPPIAVRATADPVNILPVANPAHTGAINPDFNASGANAARDFGRNGTFLVIRQLDQDTTAFNEFVRQAAQDHGGHPGMPKHLTPAQREEWIGAKMVGRWKDGTSLVKHPHRPGSDWGDRPAYPDNDFLLGNEDPSGLRCPFGAHIRRANPRDSFVPGSQEQLAITNRHRVLRAGRSYTAEGSGVSGSTMPGLLFMCFNADIERQFEFIQQTWALAWQLHDLENEVDPLLARGLKSPGDKKQLARLTIPTSEGPILVMNIRDFVRVRGGGYFFVPSRSAVRFLAS